VYNRLQEEYPNTFNLSYSTVARFVREVKSILYQPKAYLPLSFEPGTAQVDFGTASYYEHGVEMKCKYLVLTFPYSNAYYYQAFKGENQECFLTGLQNIFKHLGGVPPQIIFDNLSAAVLMKNGKRTKTDMFYKFEMHYGFEAIFCNPYSGHEKGNVENKVGYHRRNFMVPIPAINDFKSFNNAAFELCEKDMNRQHYKKESTIFDLFAEDQDCLMDLNHYDFNVYRMFKARCNKYSMVQYDKKSYSVSPQYAGREVWLYVYHDKVEIKNSEYYTIVTHRRIYGSEKELMNWLPYLNLIQKRPRALKYVGFFKTLPENWQNLFNSLDSIEEQKNIFKLLTEILLNHSLSVATEIFDETTKYGLCNAERLRSTYNRYQNNKIKTPQFKPDNVPTLPEFTMEWGEYNKLIVKEV